MAIPAKSKIKIITKVTAPELEKALEDFINSLGDVQIFDIKYSASATTNDVKEPNKWFSALVIYKPLI